MQARPQRTPSRSAAPRKPPGGKQRAAAVLSALEQLYPDADCELRYDGPLQLLLAVILSAQCTDQRVNLVTPQLFRRFPDARALAEADPGELEEIIHSTGFFRMKAKHIKEACRLLVRDHGGQVPADMDALLKLPGVARKTANVVLGTAFGVPSGVVVDTHVKRVAYRLGLTSETEPEKIERELMERLPRERWIKAGHQLILHGRRVCDARRPRCDECALLPLCPQAEIA